VATRSSRRKHSFYWIPPNTTPSYKITIERGDGTVDDVSDFISMAEFEDNVTESVGRFEIVLWNPNDEYTGVWVGNEIVRYYKDYAATATTLRFRGRVEKPSNRFNKINVKGRSEGYRMLDITVTESFSEVETGVIVDALFATYLPSFTTNNVETSSTNITVSWFQKPLFECMKELASAAGFEFYVDSSLDVHYFATGSVDNAEEAIVHSSNLLDIKDFTPDLTLIKNRVIVYGAIQEGIQVIATAEDSTSQGVNGVKELILNDDNVTSETTAQEVADFELARLKDAPEVGNVKGYLLATIQPGERIQLSSPSDDLNPGYYTTTGYVDRLDVVESGVLSTSVFVNKEPRRISHILKGRVEQENRKKDASRNPEGMRFSRNFLFAEDTGSHTNTEIVNGVLKPTGASGTWISALRTLDTDLSEAYLIMNGETLTGAVVSVSGNNGVSYQDFTANRTKLVISDAAGKNLLVKVVFDDADTQISSLSVQYKLV